MYRCSECSEVVGPHQRQHQVVVETRSKRYPPRPDAFQVTKRIKEKKVWVDDPGGVGHETVSTIALCEACFRRRRS